jgi:hypothetical protein
LACSMRIRLCRAFCSCSETRSWSRAVRSCKSPMVAMSASPCATAMWSSLRRSVSDGEEVERADHLTTQPQRQRVAPGEPQVSRGLSEHRSPIGGGTHPRRARSARFIGAAVASELGCGSTC